MATMQCPACARTVPYFCCEGLVCPACGYDEEQNILPGSDPAEKNTFQAFSPKPLPTNACASQPPA
jgi:hypothetical protein